MHIRTKILWVLSIVGVVWALSLKVQAQDTTETYHQEVTDGKVYDHEDLDLPTEDELIEQERDYNHNSYDENQEEPEYLGEEDSINDIDHGPYEYNE